MKNKKGFLLLSFLVYLTLFSMVVFFINHIITALIIPSFSSIRKSQSIIELHIALDCFFRDIVHLKEGKYAWKIIAPHELIWQKNDMYIGWCFSRNCLERREGLYQEGWQKGKASIIAKGLSNAVFTSEKNNDHITGMELILTPQCAPQKPITCYVSLKKGMKSNEKEQ